MFLLFIFRICHDEVYYGAMTIQKAIQLLCSSDEKNQAMGAYYLQHTCFQDESAKQEVNMLFQLHGGSLKMQNYVRTFFFYSSRVIKLGTKIISIQHQISYESIVHG